VFQFLATQFLAVILMSTAISDEIYHSTLGVLMTTPINSFQIVIGKLFSNLLQIVILIGISLPLLSLVRVFGGVPWSFVWSSLCVTLTAIVFAGSLSLYCTDSCRG
jgi:ABC-2 type transport system permease protein